MIHPHIPVQVNLLRADAYGDIAMHCSSLAPYTRKHLILIEYCGRETLDESKEAERSCTYLETDGGKLLLPKPSSISMRVDIELLRRITICIGG